MVLTASCQGTFYDHWKNFSLCDHKHEKFRIVFSNNDTICPPNIFSPHKKNNNVTLEVFLSHLELEKEARNLVEQSLYTIMQERAGHEEPGGHPVREGEYRPRHADLPGRGH